MHSISCQSTTLHKKSKRSGLLILLTYAHQHSHSHRWIGPLTLLLQRKGWSHG